jgi:P-aminobenzoate N-oxygenase AurF
MSTSVERLAARLSAVSQSAAVQTIIWPDKVDRDQWFMSPNLLSLYGTDLWDRIGETARKRLSFFESVNFFSLNIYGEKPLVSGLAQRIYSLGYGNVSPYIHHFLGEENRHMEYFGRFCMTYAGKIYPEKRFSLPGEFAPGEEDILFFAQTVIFEMVADYYNVTTGEDERVVPIARQINQLHHADETRHLVFGRKILADLWEQCSTTWDTETQARVRNDITAFLTATWRQYYNPDVYRDAGITDPYEATDMAWTSPDRIAFRARVEAEIRLALYRAGVLESESAQ